MVDVLPGNGLRSTLAAGINDSATTLTIQTADAAIWPSAGLYRCIICQDANNGPWELVKVTSGWGTATLSVTRAVESYNGIQTARAWPIGTSITPVITQGGLIDAVRLTSLLFSPTNSLDIGTATPDANGGVPRDLFLGRNLSMGHDLQVGGNVGFYGTTAIAKPTVSGSRGGNAALASLLTALSSLGLITDSTTS